MIIKRWIFEWIYMGMEGNCKRLRHWRHSRVFGLQESKWYSPSSPLFILHFSLFSFFLLSFLCFSPLAFSPLAFSHLAFRFSLHFSFCFFSSSSSCNNNYYYRILWTCTGEFIAKTKRTKRVKEKVVCWVIIINIPLNTIFF